MRISFTSTLEGGRVLYNIGKIEAASPGIRKIANRSNTIGGNLFCANSFAGRKMSTPTPSSASIIKAAASCGSTRPA